MVNIKASWVQYSLRRVLILWAKSRKGLGYFYKFIERYGHLFSEKKLKRKLVNGLVMECDLNDHIQQQIYFFGAYEPITTQILFSLVDEGAIFVDAGANVGFFTLMASQRVGETGEVHSFEPVPETFTMLKCHLELNGNPSNVHINSLGLWNEQEELQIGLASDQRRNCGAFSVATGSTAIKSHRIHTVKLDQYVNEKRLRKVDVIKMDIEGAEKFALEGSHEILSKYQPIICLEVNRAACLGLNYSCEDLWKMLKPFGYQAYCIGHTYESSQWIQDFSNIDQANVLLLPKSKAEKLRAFKWNDKHISSYFLGY